MPSMTEIKSCYLSKLQRLLRLRMPRVGSREDLKRLKYIRLSSYQIAFFSISFYDLWKYWCQRADKRLGDPLPKVYPGAFSGQKQGWKTPKRTSWWCTASVCV